MSGGCCRSDRKSQACCCAGKKQSIFFFSYGFFHIYWSSQYCAKFAVTAAVLINIRHKVGGSYKLTRVVELVLPKHDKYE